MIADDISLLLARAAERAGWQSVTAHTGSALWVVETDAETEIAVEVDYEAGLMHVAADVAALADATGAPADTMALLLGANDRTAETGGIVFSLSPDHERISIAVPLPLKDAESRIGTILPAVAASARNWREILTSPVLASEAPAGDGEEMRLRI